MLGGLFLWLLRRRQTACRRCPHDRGSHLSYIPGGSKPGYCGAEDGTCPCWQYQPERLWALAMAFLRERPASVPAAVVLRPRPVPFPVPDRDDDGWDDQRTRLNIPIARPYAGADSESPRVTPPQRGVAVVSGTAGWRIRERVSWADRFRLAAYCAANPDAVIKLGEFGEWYCDLPDSRSHAPTLGGLLRKLDEPPTPDTG